MDRTWYPAALRELARSNHYIRYSRCSLRPTLPTARITLDIPGFLHLLWLCWRQPEKPHTVHAAACGSRCGEAMGATERSHINTFECPLGRSQATRHAGSQCSCCQTGRRMSSTVSGICITVSNTCNQNHNERRAHGVVVSHPLRMRKALGSIPSVSNLLPSLR